MPKAQTQAFGLELRRKLRLRLKLGGARSRAAPLRPSPKASSEVSSPKCAAPQARGGGAARMRLSLKGARCARELGLKVAQC